MATQEAEEKLEDSAPMSCESLLLPMNHLPVHDQQDDGDLGAGGHQGILARPVAPAISESPSDHPELPSETASLRWRPVYLRRRTLWGFLSVFILILVALEVLLFVSDKNNGIATSTSDKHYLWTYGPTALLTIIAAMWTRVEYQSKLITPWIRLSQPGTPARDFLLSVTIAIGFAIKVIIVISTGLITLTWTRVQGLFPMVIQDEFVNSDARLRSVGTISWYIMQGLLAGKSLPDGVSSHHAFQSVQTNLPASAEMKVTVNGLTSWLECQPADVELITAVPPNYHTLHPSPGLLDLSVYSPECNVSSLPVHGVQWLSENPDTSTSTFARFTEARCDETAGDEGRRIFVIFGMLSYFANYAEYDLYDERRALISLIAGVLDSSTQLLCVPKYELTTVEVVQNGTHARTVTTPKPGDVRTLEFVSAWSIMDAHNKAYSGLPLGSPSANVSVAKRVVDADHCAETLIKSQMGSGSKVMSLFDPEILEKAASNYYSQFGAIIAKQSLLQPATAHITGSATLYQNCLVVSSWAAQWMAGLIAFCIALHMMILLFLTPARAILPCDPSTVLGMASLMLHNPCVTDPLRSAGFADDRSLGKYLRYSTFQSDSTPEPENKCERGQFRIRNTGEIKIERPNGGGQKGNSTLAHPILLHPLSRSALCACLTAIIIALEATLQKSKREAGLQNVADDENSVYYTWTAIPALILGLLAMGFSSFDFMVRSLVPYMMLEKSVRQENLPHLSLLDASIPRMLYREMRLASIGAFAITTTFLVASAFTTFSGSLFQVLPTPVTDFVTLQTYRSFNLSIHEKEDASLISTWIFANNYSYPRFTYDTLAFPALVNATPFPLQSTTASISAVIPAVRASLECRLYDSSKVKTDPDSHQEPNLYNNAYQNPLDLRIEGEDCTYPELARHKQPQRNITHVSEKATYFGSVSVLGCSDLLYTWGSIDRKPQPSLNHAAALGCNMTYEVVDVDATFAGIDLGFDLQNPPKPIEETTRRLSERTIPRSTLWYCYIASLTTGPQLLDNFFSLLVSSPWAIATADFGDPAANDRVANAIKHHHGIIVAQHISTQLIAANRTNVTLAAAASSSGLHGSDQATDADRVYNATVTDPNGRRRVVQDAAATRILEALLATALILFVVGWVTLPRTDVLPRSNLSSIASVAALVAGGNLLSRMPLDAQQLLSEEKIASALRGDPGLRLWMGWGLVPDQEEERPHGGENEARTRRFGIFVQDEEGEEGLEDDEVMVESGDDIVALQSTDYRGVAVEEQNIAAGEDRQRSKQPPDPAFRSASSFCRTRLRRLASRTAPMTAPPIKTKPSETPTPMPVLEPALNPASGLLSAATVGRLVDTEAPVEQGHAGSSPDLLTTTPSPRAIPHWSFLKAVVLTNSDFSTGMVVHTLTVRKELEENLV
ncbi:hypothetical protein PG997_001596 [Apiospora hydei]|uniref:Uncharacterized protein n=1 Tax=Apiospora hydei TaxID=1337664 RepID=A0ABR1XDY9_9PEZI